MKRTLASLKNKKLSETDLKEKLAVLKLEMEHLKERETAVLGALVKQISRTDPDAKLLHKGRMGMLVGYNVQSAVDTQYKLIVAHDVTTARSDGDRLSPTTELVQDALKKKRSQS